MENGVKQVVTQTEYAAMRGITQGAVTRYKQRGLLALDAAGLVLVEESDARLDSALDPIHGGDRRSGKTDGNKVSYLEAKTSEAQARAVKATLEAELMAGALVRVDEVEAEAFAQARAAREALMALPDRMSPLLAAETDAAKIHVLLTDELRRVCEQLAGEEPA